MIRRRFDRSGPLVIDPSVLFALFGAPNVENEITDSGVEIVCVDGPLVHHAGDWEDSYEAILDRVEAACAGPAHTIILKVSSPGGELGGCFDTARSIRARCAAAGKRLVSYVESFAASGGYAMACAAEQVFVSDTALVGSIGVLIPRVDVTANDLANGIRFAFVASGKRKADGHEHNRLTEAELEALQARVTSLATVFHDLVAELRGTTPDAIAALEAGIFHGPAAVSAGLVDSICSFDALLAQVATPGTKGPTMATEETPEETANDLDAARTALEKAAEGEGDDADRARAALAALDGKPTEEAAASEDPPADAEGDRARVSAPGTGAVVSSAAAGDLGAIIVQLNARVQHLEGASDSSLKAALIAGRPDLPKTVLALVKSKSYAAAKEIVDSIPVTPIPKPSVSAVVQSTRGAGQNSSASATSSLSPQASAMDAAMGLAPKVAAVTRDAHSLKFEIGESGAKRAASATPSKGAEIK